MRTACHLCVPDRRGDERACQYIQDGITVDDQFVKNRNVDLVGAVRHCGRRAITAKGRRYQALRRETDRRRFRYSRDGFIL